MQGSTILAGLGGLVLGGALALAWNPPTLDLRVHLLPDRPPRGPRPGELLASLPYSRALHGRG